MKKFLYLMCFFVYGIVYGQFGSNDATFNSTDVGFGSGLGASDAVEATVIQSDGKIVIGGDFIQYNGYPRNRIARLLADGRIDTDFNIGNGFNGTVNAIALQSDGKIVVGGNFTQFNGTNRSRIARLNANGTLDTDFAPSITLNSFVMSIAIQADGKILLGGLFSGTGLNRIVRLNADGSTDASFNIGTGFNSDVQSLALQSDGKILVGGTFSQFNGNNRSRIIRLNTNGSLDTDFNIGTGFVGGSNVYAVRMQANGQIVVGGDFTSFNGTGRNRIARLNSNGSLDTGFNPGAGFQGLAVFTLSIQIDGRIVVGGSFTQFNGTFANNITRLNSDGSLDTSFELSPISPTPIDAGFDQWVKGLALRADGKIIVGGRFANYSGLGVTRIARLNANGTLDNTFNPRTGFNFQPSAVLVQSDGRIVVGGSFTTYNGVPRNRIVRLNADGSIDNSFNPFNGFDGDVLAMALQSDGKIVVGGNFSSFNGTARNRIARLNANGSLDTDFSIGTGFNFIVYALAVQSDGKVLVGGGFGSFNGTARNGLARLNANGSLDTDFNIGTGFDNSVNAVAIQADGKVIVGGFFGNFNGTARNRIARLNANGSLDTDFSIGTGFNSAVYAVAVQSDGKVVLGGSFATFNGTANVNRIARLNTNGSLDTDFTANAGFGFNTIVYALQIYSDGKIIAGGEFATFAGMSRARIAALNTNGSLDTGFNPGTGFDESVVGLALQSDGKIIAAGGFTSINGIGRNRIARLNGITRTITATGTPASLNTVYGTASAATSFTVSGTNMSAGITVAPINSFFEVSLTESTGYANSIVVGSAGNIANTTVYVRLRATTPAGSYDGSNNIILSSPGANDLSFSLNANNQVSRKALTISGITANNKVYDGSTSTTLTGTPALGGIVGTDVVSIAGTPAANFDNANVGEDKPVTVTGYTLAGAAAGNYTLTTPTDLTANISPRNLTISGLTANNKVFDGTTTATLSGTATLVGVVSGDNVSVTGTPTANFDTPNIGNNKTVTVTGYTLVGTSASNYTLSMPLLLTANITETAEPTSLFDLSESNVVLYPNPTASKIFLSLPKTEVQIRVLDSQGRVLETYNNLGQPTTALELSFENKTKGIYWIELSSKQTRIVKRVVKM